MVKDEMTGKESLGISFRAIIYAAERNEPTVMRNLMDTNLYIKSHGLYGFETAQIFSGVDIFRVARSFFYQRKKWRKFSGCI